jgi:hypothetical protein
MSEIDGSLQEQAGPKREEFDGERAIQSIEYLCRRRRVPRVRYACNPYPDFADGFGLHLSQVFFCDFLCFRSTSLGCCGKFEGRIL